MKFPRNSKRKVRAVVEMTPLIDVVFQLLIFFMLSRTFVVQTSMPIEIPESQGAEAYERGNLTVHIDDQGEGPGEGGDITVEGPPGTIPIEDWGQLVEVLSAFQETSPDSVVIINADENITHKRFMEAMGWITSAGITNYAVAAQSPEQAG